MIEVEEQKGLILLGKICTKSSIRTLSLDITAALNDTTNIFEDCHWQEEAEALLLKDRSKLHANWAL